MPRTLKFSERFECKYDGTLYAQPEPRLFSFNNPFGACPTCQGFGNTIGLDLDLVIPNPALSLDEGADRAVDEAAVRLGAHGAATLLQAGEDSLGRALSGIDEAAAARHHRRQERLERRARLLRVAGDEEVQAPRPRLSLQVPRLHALPRLRRRAASTGGARRARSAAGRCPTSARSRSRTPRSSSTTLELSTEQTAIADKVLFEIRRRLKFLVDVGLDYLTLDRLASTLSGGEAQRIQLATNLGSSLVGALYVLDEPSIGLHPRDSERLIKLLHNLRDIGNTVLVVEHDEEMMRAADHILDIGPAAGELGGQGYLRRRLRGAAQSRARRSRASTCAARPRSRSRSSAAPPKKKKTHCARRARAQPQEHRRGHPAGDARLRHGRLAAPASRRSSTMSSTRASRSSAASGRGTSARFRELDGRDSTSTT